MKVNQLFEFNKEHEALLKISQVVPHMAAASISIDPVNVAKFTGLNVPLITPILKKYLHKNNPAEMVDDGRHDFNAVVALIFMLKNNHLNQTKISEEMLSQIAGISYPEIVKIAQENTQEIQKIVSAFRPNWVQPVMKREWKSLDKEERKHTIVSVFHQILGHNGMATDQKVTATEVARAIARSAHYGVKDIESLRREIDMFLSSQDPEALKLNSYRPRGASPRGEEDHISPRLTTHDQTWGRS